MSFTVREFAEFYAKQSRSSLWKSRSELEDHFGTRPPPDMTAGYLGPEPTALYT
jgi:hypothetical protein